MVFIQLNILPIPRKLINLFLNFKGFLKKKYKGEEVSIGLVACPQIGGKYSQHWTYWRGDNETVLQKWTSVYRIVPHDSIFSTASKSSKILFKKIIVLLQRSCC